MRTHEEYQEALNKIVENSCPKRTNCKSCEISSRCSALMKDEVDKLQELVDEKKPKKPKVTIINKENGAYQCDCPVCGRFLSVNMKWEDAKFCPDCETELDWSDE